MDALITIAIVLLLAAPLHVVILRLLDRLDSPDYLREVGAVVLDSTVLDSRGEIIGSFGGSPIYGSVTFMGIVYDFDKTTKPDYKRYIGSDELYLDPGLIYIAHD